MVNRKLAAGVSLGCLFLAFGTVSLLVVLTRRHPFFVNKKLRLGAMILTLSGAVVGCIPTTCYVPAPDNVFHVDQVDPQQGRIVISRSASDTLSGTIRSIVDTAFSYAVIDSVDSVVTKGDIIPVDGALDEQAEEFRLIIGTSLPPGSYWLRFYAVPADSIRDTQWYERSYSLVITD